MITILMNKNIRDYAKIGLNHHCLYPCKDNPAFHADTLYEVVNRDDIEVVDLTIPYGEPYRKRSIEVVKSCGKTVIYNGYLMPTAKIPLSIFSYTERAQIIKLAKDQVDIACDAGAGQPIQNL
jgi:hypothetical protein